MSLTRWALSHSFPRLRRNAFISTSRRSFSYVPPQSSLDQVRPSTWSARIWYRKDGAPRSKVKGLIIGSVAWLFIQVYLAKEENEKYFAYENQLLCKLVILQRMDAESFSSLDLNDFSAVKDHFTKLLAIIYPGEPFDWKLFIDNLTEDKPEECHAILREGAEEVHRTLFDGELQNPSILAGAVLSSILHVIHSAIELDVGVQSLVHGIETKNTYPEGMASKDCTPKGGEYEVVE